METITGSNSRNSKPGKQGRMEEMLSEQDLAQPSLRHRVARISKHMGCVSLIPMVRFFLKHWPSDLGKMALWNAVDKRVRWRSNPLVVQSSFGFQLSGNTRDLLARSVAYFGMWEPAITEHVRHSLKPGDVFVDVGANLGYYSLLASDLVGAEGRVVAIEASPKTFGLLQENLRLNRSTNVRCINQAVSNCEGEVVLFEAPSHNLGVATIVASWAREMGCSESGRVPAMPLSKMLTGDEIAGARIIKIDVEGAEWQVLDGLFAILDQCRADVEIIMEVTPEEIAGQGGSADELLARFQAFGFNPYVVHTDYSLQSYVKTTKSAPPRRLREPLSKQVDIVFSRAGVEDLLPIA